MLIKTIANYIRENKDIKGFKIGENIIKISLYADDITIILGDEKSGKTIFDTLKKFAMCSGLKINKEKSEGMWLGVYKDKKKKHLLTILGLRLPLEY